MWMRQESVLSPFFFAVVINDIIELVGEGVLSELLFADDLIPMSEGLRNKFIKWMEVFESKGKLTLGEPR